MKLEALLHPSDSVSTKNSLENQYSDPHIGTLTLEDPSGNGENITPTQLVNQKLLSLKLTNQIKLHKKINRSKLI